MDTSLLLAGFGGQTRALRPAARAATPAVMSVQVGAARRLGFRSFAGQVQQPGAVDPRRQSEQSIVLFRLAAFMAAASCMILSATPPFGQTVASLLSVQHGAEPPFASQFGMLTSTGFGLLELVRWLTTVQAGRPLASFCIVPVMQLGLISAPSLVAIAVIAAA